MNFINVAPFLESNVTSLVGWMLFHSVWQATIIGIVIACLLVILQKSSAQLRYVVACGGLLLMVAVPVFTTTVLIKPAGPSQASAMKTTPQLVSDSDWTVEREPPVDQLPTSSHIHPIGVGPAGETASELGTPDSTTSSANGWLGSVSSLASLFNNWIPVCVGLWIVGVCLLAIRLLAGLWRVRVWRATASQNQSDKVKSIVDQLAQRLGVPREVRILESLRASVPAVIGWLRPTILIPTSMISGLTTKELEMILAHELAHVRRHDYLFNLIQTAIETVLFFHPAVWWISNRVRIERENCCDDIAIGFCENRVEFARALAKLEELRCGTPRLSVAADGGSLVVRIRRILTTDQTKPGGWWPAGMIVLGSLALLVVSMFVSNAFARTLNENPKFADPNHAQSLSGIMTARQDESQQKPPKNAQSAQKMTVESSGYDTIDPRTLRPETKVVATHTYNSRRRVSKGWIKMNGANVPVDDGVTHQGTIVYVTLMHDVVALDVNTNKVLWELDWGKTTPMWQTVSIVELPGTPKNPDTRFAVELFAPQGKDGNPAFKYVGLLDGKAVSFPEPTGGMAPPTSTDKSNLPRILVAEQVGERITRAYTSASPSGRSPAEVFKHLNVMFEASGDVVTQGSITNMETIVSAFPRYLLDDAMDADSVLFNLPEGSGLRAEFSGESVEINESPNERTVVITNGRLELLDSGGVVRAKASADGGAELLVVKCRIENHETVLEMHTQRLVEDKEYPQPPVQVKMNLNTGAPDEEKNPPHGAIRYSIFPEDKNDNKPARMKMMWHYDLQRLSREAEFESDGELEQTLDLPPGLIELPGIRRMQLNAADPRAQVTATVREDQWGPKPVKGNLRLRLTTRDKAPKEGEPVLFKLEIKNFGDQPQQFDPQDYEPFRVLKVTNAKGESDLFVGMTPQTSGGDVEIGPGQTKTLWEKEDAGKLFMLSQGDYKIKVAAPNFGREKLPASQTISVQIQPGRQPPFKRLLGNLNEKLPRGWEVSSGWGAIFLSHTPTNLKRDATSIQVWFTEEKLADDFELGAGDAKQVVTYLGQTELGHMNVAALPKATRLWPEHIAVIKAARDLTFPAAVKGLSKKSKPEAAAFVQFRY